MFNRKLKLRVKELESELKSHDRLLETLFDTHYQNTKHASKTEDSKTFEYPYKYTYSDAKKEKNIHSEEIESYRKAFNYRLDEIHNMVNKDKELKDAPFDIRNKILNDYGKSLKRNFVFNLYDDTIKKSIKKSINEYLNKKIIKPTT
jgi:hypothetical protein